MWWKKTTTEFKPIEVKPIEIKISGEVHEILAIVRIGLVNYLTNKEQDLKKLKLELMRPLIESSWDKTNAEEADKINKALTSKGEKIRKAWTQYKEDLLLSEKQHKDTSLIKAKLEVLEKLMEGVE